MQGFTSVSITWHYILHLHTLISGTLLELMLKYMLPEDYDGVLLFLVYPAVVTHPQLFRLWQGCLYLLFLVNLWSCLGSDYIYLAPYWRVCLTIGW